LTAPAFRVYALGMRDEFVAFEDAEVLAEREDGVLCRVHGQEVLVRAGDIGIEDRAVCRPGQRGRLVIPRAVAVSLGLLPPTAA